MLCAAVAALTDDPRLLRVAVGCAALAALAAAVLLRVRDRAAAYELETEQAARSRSESTSAQRISGLEAESEVAEATRGRLERQLARQRDELAAGAAELRRVRAETVKLRGEVDRLSVDHVAALQGRAEEAAARRAAEAEAERLAAVAAEAVEAAEAARAAVAAEPRVMPTPELYLRAYNALRALEKRGAEQAEHVERVARVELRKAGEVSVDASEGFDYFGEPAPARDHDEVVDLTAHDETETLNVVSLRREHA
ncbi:hypothetical protein BIV57_02885 [Mangrovactinospora gilvigrisea]|uniref:Uncharacterized protein n=1 Tax=Mangrovactinospora gilvigrisea TaxID=1428644 RepID=A0A1J7CBN4_9ACTN|nr:hypothetical protein BIV57_02885 [Mangrovactinospora gilvigrisea]